MTAMRFLVCFATLCLVVIADPTTTRRPRRVGGFSDVDDINSEAVQNAFDAGADHLAAQSGNPCRTAYRITKAEKQVVNGIKYRFTLETDETTCGVNGAPAKICTVEVIVQSYRNAITPRRPYCRNA